MPIQPFSFLGCIEAAAISAISPALGDIHGNVPLTLTVTGSVTGVKIGGTACTSVVQHGGSGGGVVTCLAPAKAAGTYDVQVFGPLGGGETLVNGYEAWHPTVDYAAARVFQSDQGVTSSSSATRTRSGFIAATPYPTGTERDGMTMVQLRSGRLLMIGGWHGTPVTDWNGNGITNEVRYSDDGGYTWAVLLAHDDTPPTSGAGARFYPGHTAGVLLHVDGSGTEWVYWIGTDANAGASRDGGVWRSSDNGSTWTRISTAAPTNDRSLFMVASYLGNLYVMGGQLDLGDPSTALSEVWRSTDDGITWTKLANAPWAARGALYNPVLFTDGKLYVAGGATYSPTAGLRTFYNDVWKYDGASWTNVLGDGHGQWTQRHYHSFLLHNGLFWVINGFDASGNLADAYFSADGATWTQAATVAWSASPTHAQAAVSVLGGILVTQGVQGTGVYKIDDVTGALVSAWADQGSGGLSVTQSTAGAKPVLDSIGFGSVPGIAFSGGQYLSLASIDRSIAGGVYEAWFVGRTLNTISTALSGGSIDPPCPIIGTFSSSAFNEFGFNLDALEYHDGSVAWAGGVVARGSGLNEDRPRLYGVEHTNAPHVKLFVGTTQQGTTQTSGIGFDTTWTGWDSLGTGINVAGNAVDFGRGLVGAVVILKTNAPSSGTFRSKLNAWAKKWGSIT